MHASMTERPNRPFMKSSRTRRFVLFFIVAALFFIGALLARPWGEAKPQAASTPERSTRFGASIVAGRFDFANAEAH